MPFMCECAGQARTGRGSSRSFLGRRQSGALAHPHCLAIRCFPFPTTAGPPCIRTSGQFGGRNEELGEFSEYAHPGWHEVSCGFCGFISEI
jgi:hypothetical protein